MALSVNNTNTQNITTLAYNATGINNSQDKISKAMSALYLGIYQYGINDLLKIKARLVNNEITLDTYVGFQPPSGNPIVDTAGNILEKYAY